MLGIRPDGTKEMLGLWIEQAEEAKFWLRVMNDLKARGLADIPIAVVDGLKGFPDATTAVFPETVVQTCIVHLIWNSRSSCRGTTARRSFRSPERFTALGTPTPAGRQSAHGPADRQCRSCSIFERYAMSSRRLHLKI